MSARTGADGLVADVAAWRIGAAGRAPAYHALLEVLVGLLDGPGGAAIADRFGTTWADRRFDAVYERPLLILGALRYDALREGPSHPLFAAIGARAPDPAATTADRLRDALSRDTAWASMGARFVQTNETTRAVAWRWPAFVAGCDGGGRPLGLVEIGAAAGLNLVADRLPAPWVDGTGTPLPVATDVDAFLRLGIDRFPLDVREDADATWLRACVWGGETAREDRLDAAIAAFRAAPAQVVPGDVTDAPARLRAATSARPERGVVLALQTIVRDYLPADTRSAYEAAMRGWLADAPPGAALWVELEIDAGDPSLGVSITAHVHDGDRVADLRLATTGYHPTAVAVDAAAVARLGLAVERAG